MKTLIFQHFYYIIYNERKYRIVRGDKLNAAIITLCVAVATFILQEGITNIIHGIIFRLFSRVHDGDRIEIFVDGTSYTGTISKRNLRQIIINDIQTNAEIIIPNCKIDMSIIKNSYNGKEEHNKYIVELPISYHDAENSASSAIVKDTINKTINDCKLTIAPTPNIIINYKDSYVGYSFFVITASVEDNFKACSWIKETLLQTLAEKNIHIPFNTIDVNVKHT